MAVVASNSESGFWKASPSAEVAPVTVMPTAAKPAIACSGCATEFIPGAGFCHACGQSRSKRRGVGLGSPGDAWVAMQAVTGLRSLPLGAFMVGCTCLFVAVLVGREGCADWLIGAIAAFQAGILLKSPG